MEENPIQNDARKTKRERKLGENAACAHCGDRRPEVLEKHHVVGKANEPNLTIILCRNCHRVQTECDRQSGASMRTPNNILERFISMLKALGSFFIKLGEILQQWAEALGRFMAGLDARCPLWRAMPEAN